METFNKSKSPLYIDGYFISSPLSSLLFFWSNIYEIWSNVEWVQIVQWLFLFYSMKKLRCVRVGNWSGTRNYHGTILVQSFELKYPWHFSRTHFGTMRNYHEFLLLLLFWSELSFKRSLIGCIIFSLLDLFFVSI